MNKNSRKAAETQRARKKLMNDFWLNRLEGKIIKMKTIEMIFNSFAYNRFPFNRNMLTHLKDN